MAGAERLELSVSDLESDVLAANTMPPWNQEWDSDPHTRLQRPMSYH
jgi:hypothetical protein